MEEEVFEINDYSTSSEWERFISDLEEALTQWNLNETNFDDTSSSPFSSDRDLKNDNTRASSSILTDPKRWIQKQEQLKFGKVSFILTFRAFQNKNLQQNDEKNEDISSGLNKSTNPTASTKNIEGSGLSQAWSDMNNLDHDWTASGHPLIRYYGLTQFLTLTCAKNDLIDTEDRIKHLLGSAAIALKNMNCEIPFFVQICQPHRRLFSGIHTLNSGFRTYFDMIQFSDVPSSFQYLSELVTLYKKKLDSSFSYSSVQRDKLASSLSSSSSTAPVHYSPFEKHNKTTPKIQISVRFTYLLTCWSPQYFIFNGNSPLHPVFEEFSYLRSSPQSFNILPCQNQHLLSNFLDSLNQFQLSTTWPSVAEELIVDNAYHSDLQPRNAPRWSLRAVFNEHKHHKTIQLCWSSQWFKRFLELKIKYHLRLLSRFNPGQRQNQDSLPNDSEPDFRSAFDRFSSPAERAIASTKENLDVWFQSDERDDKNHFSKSFKNIHEWIDKTFNEDSYKLEEYSEEDKLYRDFKASPIGSLSWKIAVLMANTYSQNNTVESIAFTWNLIVERLREYWENGKLLPAMDDCNGTIDYGHCLFHQKIQMLNNCILQKIKRENILNKNKSTMIDHQTSHVNPMKIIQEEKIIDAEGADDGDGDDDEEFYDCESEEINMYESGSEGQLSELKDHNGQVQYRLDRNDIPIYVPQTQNPAPMTEDQHQQHVQVIGSLSNSPDDVKLKIRMQSSGLLSDMEAFKAANPDVCFEDFIRWHSPRDWVEIEQNDSKSEVKFGLSRRMKESTLWSEIWSLAKPVPITRQTRLFNYTKEAEVILHSFEAITVERLVILLAPILGKSLIKKLKQFKDEIHNFIQQNVDKKDQISESFLDFNFKEFETMLNCSKYENFIEESSTFEYEISKYLSILKKFIFSYESEVKKPFKNLLETQECNENIPKQPKIGTGRKIGSKAIAASFNKNEIIYFTTRLLLEPDVEFLSSNSIASLIVRLFADGNRFEYENRTAVGERLPGHDGLVNDDNHHQQQQQQHNDRKSSSSQSDQNHHQQQPRMFTIPQLPSPNGKEFIFRASAISRPAPYSRPSSQRFYASLLPGKDFRIATAFTEDTLYF